MGLREAKKERTREALAAAATRLFTERGYEATTVEDIAAAAEVSPRTFFRYYPLKDDVVTEIFRMGGFETTVAARPPDEPVIASLRAAAMTVLRECAENPAPTLAVLRMVASQPALRTRLAEAQREWTAVLTTSITTRLGAAHDPLLPRLLTNWALATLDAVLTHWESADGRLDLLELTGRAFDRLAPALDAILVSADSQVAHTAGTTVS
ncbi:TetR family transcriptional regulator [Parafrankia elaeagni]|uniref:TetR family transcriptional regulator n=1 Tax=Parafrankia elaeagni TaxID=222534 RepID=UPI0005520330|nr:TetR family transcriptional regulator [Parafrankia elaeagni]